MNIYLIPINEVDGPYIKKIIANNENLAKEKLYNYFFNKYEELEGITLEDIEGQLWDLGVDLGQIYDIEEFN